MFLMQMAGKGKRQMSHSPEVTQSSSEDEDFVPEEEVPIPKVVKVSRAELVEKGKKKTTGAGSSKAPQGAAPKRTKGRASPVIKSPAPPLRSNFKYTFRDPEASRLVELICYQTLPHSAEVEKIRNTDPFQKPTTVEDYRFWDLFQANWYVTQFQQRAHSGFNEQRWLDVESMKEKCDGVITSALNILQRHGILNWLKIHQDWNKELVAQFISTAWIEGTDNMINIIHFMIEGQRRSVTLKDILAFLEMDPRDYSKENAVHIHATNRDMGPLYLPGFDGDRLAGNVHGMLPVVRILNSILRNTLTPKYGDRVTVQSSSRDALLALMSPDANYSWSLFFWVELCYAIIHGSSYVPFAPYIQIIINKKFDMEFRSSVPHKPYKPQSLPDDYIKLANKALAGQSGEASTSSATVKKGKENIILKGIKLILKSCQRNDAMVQAHIRETRAQFTEIQSHLSLPEPQFSELPPPVPGLEEWYEQVSSDEDDDEEEEGEEAEDEEAGGDDEDDAEE